MILKKLNILNYRNIAEASLCFKDKINCFVGNNGEGKTNTLDAIHFLSFTKGIAVGIDSQNVRHGADTVMIQGIYDLNGIEEDITCGFHIHQKKHVKRNKKEYKRLSEHIGLLPLVVVSPYDSELILGGSEERRRFMDLVISQYDSEYMNILSAYNKALQQRNAMLKVAEEQGVNDDVMSAYEDMMGMYGERIYGKRRAFIEEFVPVFQQFHEKITGDSGQVGINYVSHCQRGPLTDVIRQGRQKDVIMGYSLHGIHKDELEMTLGGFPIRREGSQGQNKSYLIAMKLSQFRFLCRTGSRTTPILLLDDIFDKLDSRRVHNIIDLVSGPSFGQIFITDTNRENLDKIIREVADDYAMFRVENGVITQYES